MPRQRIPNQQNLALDNRNLAGANWTDISSATSRTGSVGDPFGGTQACTVSEMATVTGHAIYNGASLFTLPANSWFCISVFLKPGTGNFAGLLIDGGGSFQIYSFFDLTTGQRTALGNGGGPFCQSLDTAVSSRVGNSLWRRYSMRGFNAGPALGVFMQVVFSFDGTTVGYLGDPTRNYVVFAPAVALANQPGDITDTSSGLINASGRIRNVALNRRVVPPQNLLKDSETFVSTTWTQTGATPTAGALAGPIMGTRATALTDNTNSTFHLFEQSPSIVSTVAPHCFSVYAHSGSRNFLILVASTISLQYFDLSNGSFGVASPPPLDAGIEFVGNGWYRCWIVERFPSTAQAFSANSNGLPSYAANSDNAIYLWGAQVTQGTKPVPYVGTADTANLAGFLGTRIAAVKSHNTIRGSQDFDGGNWIPFEGTVVGNSAVAPNGTLTADALFETSNNNYHILTNAVTTPNLPVGVTHTFSVYLKAGTQRYAGIYISVSGADGAVVVDLLTGAATLTLADAAGMANFSHSVSRGANGWYRVAMTFAPKLDWTGVGAYGVVMSNDGVSFSYAGNPANSIFMWGFQMVRANQPGDYVPTNAAPVNGFLGLRNSAAK